MANISNIFLAQCWGLKTSSRSFYGFIKINIAIWRDLAISPFLPSCNLPFLNVPYSPFQKKKKKKLNETLES